MVEMNIKNLKRMQLFQRKVLLAQPDLICMLMLKEEPWIFR